MCVVSSHRVRDDLLQWPSETNITPSNPICEPSWLLSHSYLIISDSQRWWELGDSTTAVDGVTLGYLLALVTSALWPG